MSVDEEVSDQLSELSKTKFNLFYALKEIDVEHLYTGVGLWDGIYDCFNQVDAPEYDLQAFEFANHEVYKLYIRTRDYHLGF